MKRPLQICSECRKPTRDYYVTRGYDISKKTWQKYIRCRGCHEDDVRRSTRTETARFHDRCDE